MTATYRDTPLLKPPVWTWEVPVYFFIGGAAGVAAVIAAAAQFSGLALEPLARDAKWIAVIGALISPLLLISDLGRPARFLNMLRVFKPQSPMSVGVWTLVVFSNAAIVALLPLGMLADAATLVAAATGSILATYTGVLIGATAIPVWARNVDILPIHFGASGLGAAVSILELLGHRTAAMNALGILAATVEMLIIFALVRRGSSSGALMHGAEVLSGPMVLVLRIAAVSMPGLQLPAAACAIAGSLMTRFAWIDAGRRSAYSKESGEK
ncbi:MAG TPA: NrfD/PsrC family molybdoenzyme membrane anchor subunit [Vicinamibacterales bacterium]|nr:NrfD/PsrC family molybdoenzyme membrane anchor subunit [Vicinamibacterales bacterium]